MLYGLLAVVLMAMDHRGNYVPRVRSIAQHAIEPVYHAVEWPVKTLHNLLGQFQSRSALLEENDRLTQQLLAQQGALQQLQTLQGENHRLRALFEGAKSQPHEYHFAELVSVALDPFSHQVIIDRGGSDGVQPGQAVIDGQGVMGQVEDVQLHFSIVRLISDPSHALPVQISRSGLRTVAFGMGETNRLNLPNVPREADVREGDLIVTSGLANRFPGGYPVAVVTVIDREEGRTFARVEATPLAALDRGHEVLLISLPQGLAEADESQQAETDESLQTEVGKHERPGGPESPPETGSGTAEEGE
jgi:rod shape-determining protein MreC